jgi:hypothetical protein
LGGRTSNEEWAAGGEDDVIMLCIYRTVRNVSWWIGSFMVS